MWEGEGRRVRHHEGKVEVVERIESMGLRIWWGRELSHSKVDRFVPETQHVNLRIAGEGLPETCSGSEAGWFARLIDVCITPL